MTVLFQASFGSVDGGESLKFHFKSEAKNLVGAKG